MLYIGVDLEVKVVCYKSIFGINWDETNQGTKDNKQGRGSQDVVILERKQGQQVRVPSVYGH